MCLLCFLCIFYITSLICALFKLICLVLSMLILFYTGSYSQSETHRSTRTRLCDELLSTDTMILTAKSLIVQSYYFRDTGASLLGDYVVKLKCIVLPHSPPTVNCILLIITLVKIRFRAV